MHAFNLSTADRGFLEKHFWYFNVPLEGNNAPRFHIDVSGNISEILLDQIDFKGKTVLNIGCREGYFAFLAESRGASRVVAIDNQPSDISSGKIFEILKNSVNSKVEYRQMSEDLLFSTTEQFDIVLLSDCLCFSENPQKLLETAGRLCSGQIWLLSHFILDNTETPLSVLLRNYSPAPAYPAKQAFNLAWLLNSMDSNYISVNQAKLHPNMKLVSICGKPKKGLRDTKKIKYAEMPTDEKRTDKLAILIMSCKKFEQLWDPFFILFKRYWPDCPYKVYFCTDTGSYPGVENIEIGKDLGWANNCKFALQKISADRIILMQEDFLLTSPVNTEQIRKFAEHAHTYDIGCLRLAAVPGATAPWFATDELGVLQPFDDYRLSMQTAIWKRQLLNDLLVEGESPWQVEIEGTKRAALRPEIFLSTWEGSAMPIPYYMTAVEKGYWKEGALELLDKEGIPRTHIQKKVY
jgi:SAM-dependent methyltransferase